MRYFGSIVPQLSRNLKLRITQNPTFCDSLNPNSHLWNRLNFVLKYTSSAQVPSERVSSIVDEISGLTLLEVSDLTELLRKKLDINEMPVMAVMMPGMGFGLRGAGGAAPKAAEVKAAEKTAFDLKLEAFDAAAKIKIIKEVRTFTDLGLKEAKDLVEHAPTLLKKGVPKEEAENIIEKMKAVGAKVTME
ncbi:54S ribosomal protein L12, mitochondrial [Vitis vinifera]|uniref:54S ribosomal protein L12, mitochondrial n=1 Tax=Vitis vinifera TaxID=29760 RepID=A0A438K5U3_VITVI|nr:54S ribosomal protein L12, mitochondrial [Vitis vinifera]